MISTGELGDQATRSRLNGRLREAKKDDLVYDSSTDNTSNDDGSSMTMNEGVIEYRDDDHKVVTEEPKGKKTKTFYEKHEVSRKAFHSATGFFTVWLYVSGYDPRQLVKPLALITAGCFTQDIIRFKSPSINKRFVKYYGFMMRENETEQFNGTSFYALGVLLTLLFLPKDLVVICNIFLSWGDTIASMAGREFGYLTPKVREGKSLAGVGANFILAYLVTRVFYGYMIPHYTAVVDNPGDIFYSPNTSYLSFEVYCIMSGLVSCLSEVISVFDIDDNLTIPTLSGILLRSLVTVFHR